MAEISLNNPTHRYILQCVLRTITNKTKSKRKQLAEKYENLKAAEVIIDRKDFKGKFNIKFHGGMKGMEDYLNFLHDSKIIWPADLSRRGEPILFDYFSRDNIMYSPTTESMRFGVFFAPATVASFLKKLREMEKDYLIKTKYANLNTQNGVLTVKDTDGTIIKDRTKRLKTNSANFLLLKILLEKKVLTIEDIDRVSPKTSRKQKIARLRKILGISLEYDEVEESYPRRSTFPFQIRHLKNKYKLYESR
ncbi:MAG: hypothetical protein WC458_02015 [Patescibacteria group bacterium]|jgi:hypothetical protein